METKSPIQIERSKAMEAAWKAYSERNEALKLYDEECERGIMHTPAWDKGMEQYRNELPSLYQAYQNANKAYMETVPPYDPDNHIAGCGCVVQDGKLTHWCGDHF